MFREIHHEIAVVHAIASQSLGATGSGGKVSKIIDTAGYGAVEFALNYGTIAATGATVVVGMKDGDVTGTLATVTAANITGSLAAAGIGATSARASGVSKNVAKSVGYIGIRRYVEITMAPTVSGGIIASATAILAKPRNGPTPAGA